MNLYPFFFISRPLWEGFGRKFYIELINFILKKLIFVKLNLRSFQQELGETFDPHQFRKLREEQLTEAHTLQFYNQKRLDSMQQPTASNKSSMYPNVQERSGMLDGL
jgi:hypothetical protein